MGESQEAILEVLECYHHTDTEIQLTELEIERYCKLVHKALDFALYKLEYPSSSSSRHQSLTSKEVSKKERPAETGCAIVQGDKTSVTATDPSTREKTAITESVNMSEHRNSSAEASASVSTPAGEHPTIPIVRGSNFCELQACTNNDFEVGVVFNEFWGSSV